MGHFLPAEQRVLLALTGSGAGAVRQEGKEADERLRTDKMLTKAEIQITVAFGKTSAICNISSGA
ncbi:MAG: hypothetical protein ACLRXQ_09020 [Phascolarctobacterium faecium]